MNENQFIFDKDAFQWVAKSRIENQTIEVRFSGYCNKFRVKNHWWVSACIYNKRKDKSSHYENFDSSGNIGIKGLIEIKNILIDFENFVKKQYVDEGHYIVIWGSDARRRRIYKKYLGKIGYRIGKICGDLVNYKKIN